MRSVCLSILTMSTMFAQDGAAIYKERCSSCHDMPAARVPSLATIKAMSGEAIYIALTNGIMKSRAEGLSTPELFALIGYIAPTGGTQTVAPSFSPTCKSDAPFRIDPGSPQWNGWSTSATNSRFQDAASAGLAVSSVPKLKLKWAFNLGDVSTARSQPAVVGGRVFIATATGAVYSFDADTGCTRWGYQANTAGVRSGVTVGEAKGVPAVFFGDTGANIYALNAQTGQLIWKVRPVDHFAAMATATPRYYKGVIYQPFSSFEEVMGPDPKYGCCTFRGSVVALDAGTGKKLWQTFTIADAAKATRKNPAGSQQFGPSGAAVWSTPTIDEQLGVLYVATGDNYSDPPTNTSDAILAMQLKTGELLWSKQLTENDAFNTACGTPQPANCPEAKGPDYDFGQPPILVELGDGKRALVIGQKSGMVHAVDPDQKGKILWQTRAGRRQRARREPVGFGIGRAEGVCRDRRCRNWRRAGSKNAPGLPAGPRSQERRRTARVELKDREDRVEREGGALRGRKDRLFAGPIGRGQCDSGRGLLGVGRRTSASVLDDDGRSVMGYRYRARVRHSQRQSGSRRVAGCFRTSRRQWDGFCEFRLRSIWRHARKCVPCILGERKVIRLPYSRGSLADGPLRIAVSLIRANSRRAIAAHALPGSMLR